MPLDIRAVSTSSTLALSYGASLRYMSVSNLPSVKTNAITPSQNLSQNLSQVLTNNLQQASKPSTKQHSPEQIYCIVKEPSLQNNVTSLF